MAPGVVEVLRREAFRIDVAIVRDVSSIVHANAHHMATAVESTRDAIARIKAAGIEVTSIKRLD